MGDSEFRKLIILRHLHQPLKLNVRSEGVG
jgi:hypothetical protein